MNIANKTLLITGANRGIGRALVDEALRREVKRVYAGTRGAPLTAGGRVTWLTLDVTDASQIERAAAEIETLDILINNAGINRDAMAAKMTEEQWDAVLSVNLKGTFLCAQAALPGMRERGWGRVVNTSSIGSLGNIGQANYAASKAGVIGLTKTLALEYAKYGVTVNAIAPGPVMTAMLAGVPDTIRERIIAQVPVGRIASPDEIAGVHVFLASDEAAFITGQVIFADGGMSVGI